MSKLRKIIPISIITVLLLGLFLIIGLIFLLSPFGNPEVENNSVLILKISGDLPDYVPEDSLAKALGFRKPPSFTELLIMLRKAKVDARVGAVLLDIDAAQFGWGKADELRDAIAEFRKSGKPIYAFMELGQNKDYYIAAACEKVFLPPSGDIYVNGFAAEAMFYRGSLDKLGIEPEVIQIGKYKSAPEQYTRKEMSDAQREVINAMLDDYYARFVDAIAAGRKKSPEDVRAIIDNAPYHGSEARQIGLTDGALYRDQVYDELKNRLGYKADDKIRLIGSESYRDVPADSLGLNNGERVAVIYASGAINVGKSSRGGFSGEMIGSDTFIKAINDAAEDSSVKAIILRVDSPGGSALASDLMWHALENAKAKKPLVVSMADVAASGGYYISCNADKIVAEPSTVTGSIGVFMGKPVVKGLYDWLGVTNEYVMRGKNAGIFRETEKWTPAERAKMEEQTNKIYYDDFVPKVAKGRNKSPEDVNSIGQGRVWTGAQAKQNGLIDEFGGLEKAIEIAKNLAKIPAEKQVKRIIFPTPRSFLRDWFGGDDDSTFAQTKQEETLLKAMPEDARKSLRFAKILDQMKDGKAMLMLPYELEIK